MTCRSCLYHFCWMCLGRAHDHSFGPACSKYSPGKGEVVAQEQARAELARFLHYCNRYLNHQQSLKFENKLHESVQEKMRSMQHYKMSWIEVQFLKKAVDILCACRQSLMYTYVFAFYLKPSNHQEMFENNQRDLEAATESLSEYLERDVTSDAVKDIKQKIQDKTSYCDARRKALLEHVHEGYDNDWWSYREQ